MSKGLDLIKRQQPEFINDFPTGNICIGVTEEELTELEQALDEGEKAKEVLDIIIKKVVDMQEIGYCKDFEDYKSHYENYDEIEEENYLSWHVLTETEFNLIKEWLEK